MNLYENELNNYQIYTDLNREEIREKFNLSKIIQVDNIYQYMDKGIIITSWENTDFSQAETVHLIQSDGERVALTRRPTLYCSNSCGLEAQEIVRLLSDNRESDGN